MRRSNYLILLLSTLTILAGCSRQLEIGLTEKDAQEIVVALRRNGIEATATMDLTDKKSDSNWQVSVKGGGEKMVAAWNILRENGLPRDKVKGLEEVFANSGMIPTAAEEKARLLTGLKGELTRMLNSVPGVVDSHVQVVLPDNSPLLDENQRVPATASVLVRYRGTTPPLKEDEIKRLVARGIEGLKPEGVAVVLKQGELKALPPQMYGPLELSEWFLFGALCLSGITGTGAIALMAISKKRSIRIKQLENQLADVSALKPGKAGAIADENYERR
jgi:type III secretion protein J